MEMLLSSLHLSILRILAKTLGQIEATGKYGFQEQAWILA